MSPSLLTRLRLGRVIRRLRRVGRLPRNIQISRIGDSFVASVFDQSCVSLMNPMASSGVAANPDLASLIALVEHVERLAFLELKEALGPGSLPNGTDGFAAFPVSLLSRYKDLARKSARLEALERYCWATWWDDLRIGYRRTIVTDTRFSDVELRHSKLLLAIQEQFAFQEIMMVQPYVDHTSETMVILIAVRENGGVITGGAAAESAEKAFYRALSELYRHGVGWKRFEQSGLPPTDDYERRLVFFASGEGSDLVRSRLATNGNGKIQLPDLECDEEVVHSISDTVYVHRCLFRNQPQFLGGPISRLCL